MEFELLNMMINQIGDELVLIDREGKIVFINDTARKALGYSREHLLKKRVFDFYKNKTTLREWQQQRFFLLKQQRTWVSYEVERIVKSGKVQTILVTAGYLQYRDQEYILAIGRDITRQVEMQKQLVESEERYRILCEGAGDPILMLDLDEQISYINPAGERFLNAEQKDVLGKDFYRFVHKDSLSALKKLFVQVKKTATQGQVELEIKGHHQPEPVPVEMVISPLKKGHELVGTHLVIRDIRQRRELELLLRESEKIQAIQYFVSGTAQKLKHPLLGILAQTQAVLSRYRGRNFEYITFKDFAKIMQTLERVCHQMEYCYHTADHLLDLKQKKVGFRKDLSRSYQVIQDVMESRAVALKNAGIRLVLHVSKDLPPVAMGKVDLSKVISNLVDNALHAMPGGGILRIGTHFLAAQEKVRIEIKDSGVGIPEEDLEQGNEKVFKLGLSVVYALVKSSHGGIHIESSLRRGTTVTLELPIAKAAKG